MDVRDIIATKRDGGSLSVAEIDAFISGYTAGSIEDYHASALLMAIFLNGMQPEELGHWTAAMMNSGRVMRFENLGRPAADKHSTGGVGDKASIPLAPAVAACGVAVPMISGRGLGHTGGTLDKLESIPGFCTELDGAQFERALSRVGAVFGAQTSNLVPADRKLYALRNATGLVLDVKFGSGAFLPDPEKGAELGRQMILLAKGLKVPTRVLLTAMDRPLGLMVGHTREILESVACLEGAGPPDLRSLVCALGGEMLHLAGIADSTCAGESRIAASLDDGSALTAFENICAQQGATPGVYFDERGDPKNLDHEPFLAEQGGHLCFRDVCEVGLALADLGGGRLSEDQTIDPGVAIEWHCVAGDSVSRGEPLCTIHHRQGAGLESARVRLRQAINIGPNPSLPPLILDRFG
jgi:thymidine phosphorylase